MNDVAVIIPTHNRATLLPDALDSVIAQTVSQRIEVAVIDDGSTDDTERVMADYLDRCGDPAARVCMSYTRLDKQGVVTARNTGLAKTSAPLVAFLDSDDYWHRDKLARQIEILIQQPSVGVVHTSFRYVDESGTLCDDGPQRPTNPCVGACVPTLLDEDLVIFSSVLMRRSIIDRAAADEPHGLPFDPRWTNAQDYDLLLRAARLCEYAYVADPMTMYRLHGAHGAMGNLPRAFGFHAQVQIDFAKRHGESLGLTEADGRSKAAAFLWGRADSAFWQRELQTAHSLCEVAEELGVADLRFEELKRKASRPSWMYAAKDRIDQMIGKQPSRPGR